MFPSRGKPHSPFPCRLLNNIFLTVPDLFTSQFMAGNSLPDINVFFLSFSCSPSSLFHTLHSSGALLVSQSTVILSTPNRCYTSKDNLPHSSSFWIQTYISNRQLEILSEKCYIYLKLSITPQIYHHLSWMCFLSCRPLIPWKSRKIQYVIFHMNSSGLRGPPYDCVTQHMSLHWISLSSLQN